MFRGFKEALSIEQQEIPGEAERLIGQKKREGTFEK